MQKRRELTPPGASAAVPAHLVEAVHGFPVARSDHNPKYPVHRLLHQDASRNSIRQVKEKFFAGTTKPIRLDHQVRELLQRSRCRRPGHESYMKLFRVDAALL